MDYTHNIRFETHSKDRAEREALKDAYEEWLGEHVKKRFTQEDLTHPDYEPIYKLTLWLDKQRHMRPVLETLQEELSDESIKTLLDEARLRQDERHHVYFRLDKQAFLDGELRLVNKGDVVQVRLNLAAYPKNEDTVAQKLREVLTANL